MGELFLVLIGLAILAIAISHIRSPGRIGARGERRVNRVVRWSLNSDVYELFDDVTLPTVRGTTQIDHIVVSRYGVFVIETKNMKGWIFGGERQRQWTQVLYTEKHKFQNPLRQNYLHTETLRRLLGLEKSQVFSVVAFVGDSEFRTPMPDNVTEGRDYIRYIKSKRIPLLTAEQVAMISARISQSKLASDPRTLRKKHIQSLNERHGSHHACPKCGAPLVERVARKGPNAGRKFLGCSRYPACRGIVDLD
jgi:hypothetical protein